MTTPADPFLVLSSDDLLEVTKMFGTVLGGAAVAWFTVWLATNRYKKEKRWDRRVSSIADLLSALVEMRDIAAEWSNEALMDYTPSEEYTRERAARYRAAKNKFRDVSSLAMVLWPQKSLGDILDHHRIEIQKIGEDPHYDSFTRADEEIGVISATIRRVVEVGREELF